MFNVKFFTVNFCGMIAMLPPSGTFTTLSITFQVKSYPSVGFSLVVSVNIE